MHIIEGGHQDIGNTHKIERGVTMNENARNQLEEKLKKMLNHLDQPKAKQNQPIAQAGTGNIIRRRKGEDDKRFSTCIQPSLCAAAGG
jgi:LysM repeat protein